MARSLTIQPVSPVLGAEVHGVDLAQGISDEDFALVHQAFLDHSVLFFRDQPELPAEAQVDFARRFGPLHTHPAAPTSADNDQVFVIHAHRDSPVANGNGWHTDVSCDEEPPLATMLQIQVTPDGGGGDTMFASMEAAYATLPEADRTELRGLSALHQSEHIYRGRYADRGVDDDGTEYPSCVHPVIRTHPETLRPSIFVNPSFTTRILDVDEGESKRLLRRLYRHQSRPEFQVRFRWERNDVAIWDNRCLHHFAIWDYWPNERKGNRVTIRGDRPYFDPDAPEPELSPLRLSGGSLAGGSVVGGSLAGEALA